MYTSVLSLAARMDVMILENCHVNEIYGGILLFL